MHRDIKTGNMTVVSRQPPHSVLIDFEMLFGLLGMDNDLFLTKRFPAVPDSSAVHMYGSVFHKVSADH